MSGLHCSLRFSGCDQMPCRRYLTGGNSQAFSVVATGCETPGSSIIKGLLNL
jgi:hypothetical protein